MCTHGSGFWEGGENGYHVIRGLAELIVVILPIYAYPKFMSKKLNTVPYFLALF